jgi:hypothetical protein
VWCGRLARLEDGQWRYCRFDATFYEKTPLALRTTPFQEGEDDEDWHARTTYDM